MKRFLWLLLLLAPCASGQVVVGNGLWQYVYTAPSGSCGQNATPVYVIGPGTIYGCQSGTWGQIGGNATGLTSVGLTANGGATCGDLTIGNSPLTSNGTLTLTYAGTNGDVVSFNSSGCQQDSGTLLSALETTAAAQAAFSGIGACINQFVTATNANATPTCASVSGSQFATFTAHQFFGNNTGSTAAPAPSAIGTSDTTPNDYIADSGAVNAYVGTLSPAMTSLTTGVYGCFKAANQNTGTTPTINFNGLGATTIVKLGGGAVAVGDITTAEPSCVIYDGTHFLLLNPQGSTGGGKFVLSSSPSISNGLTVAGGITDTSIGMTTSAMSSQSNATCTNVTGMSWAMSASKNYRLSCVVPVTFAASATIAFCLGGPGTATSYSLNADGPIGAAGVYGQINTLAQTAWGTKTSASGATAGTEVIHVDAVIQNGTTASGTNLTLQTAANGTNNITVLANAMCTLTQAN